MDKLEAADRADLDVRLITQLCFDSEPIAAFVGKLRARGIAARLRVGLAGPASPARLLKYAAICGVGSVAAGAAGTPVHDSRPSDDADPGTHRRRASLRLRARDPGLDITGLHFFTFASLRHTIEWAREALAGDPARWEASQ
jgi:methylenetetrahydrofolate reductase (NADPH)